MSKRRKDIGDRQIEGIDYSIATDFLDKQEARELRSRAIPIATYTTGMLVFFVGALWMTLQIKDLKPEPAFFLSCPFVFIWLLFSRPFSTFTSRWGRYLNNSYFVVKTLLVLPGLILSFALLYRTYGLLDGEQPTTDPDTCLYFSMVTWTTLGYGDVRPIGFARAIAASEALFGHVVMTILVVVIAVKLQFLRKFVPGKLAPARAPRDIPRFSWRRLVSRLESMPPDAFYFKYTWFGSCVLLLFDYMLADWLIEMPRFNNEIVQNLAIFVTPFFIGSALLYGKLFNWPNEMAFYYERAYFALKAVFAIPGMLMAYAYSYRVLGLFDGNQRVTDATTALYFSIVTWTTLGYGDVRPAPEARLLAASEALVGYITMAVFVGIFADFVLRWFFENREALSKPR